MPPVDTRLLIPKSRLGDTRDEMTGDTAEGMSPDTVWGRRTTDAAIGSAIALNPIGGGTDEFPGVFGGCPCCAFNSAISAASASANSTNCSRLNSASASRSIGASA